MGASTPATRRRCCSYLLLSSTGREARIRRCGRQH